MSLLFNAVFMSALLGHLAVDTLNGSRSVLFTYLIVPMGMATSDQ